LTSLSTLLLAYRTARSVWLVVCAVLTLSMLLAT
jgi:hypothetical protein